jgi:hypothetical protein
MSSHLSTSDAGVLVTEIGFELSSFASGLASLLLIVAIYLQANDQRKALGVLGGRQNWWSQSILFWISVSDFLASWSRFVYHLLTLSQISQSPSSCLAQTLLIFAYFQATWLWTLVYIIDVFRQTQNRTSNLPGGGGIHIRFSRQRTFHWSYHLFCWGVPAILLLGNYFMYTPPFDYDCSSPASRATVLSQLVTIVPLLIIYFIIPIFIYLIRKKIEEKHGVWTVEEREERMIITQQAHLQWFIFVFCYTSNILAFFVSFSGSDNGVVWVNAAADWTSALQGVMNAGFYILTNEGRKVRLKKAFFSVCKCFRRHQGEENSRYIPLQ